MNCKNCGALLKGSRCSLCGTIDTRKLAKWLATRTPEQLEALRQKNEYLDFAMRREFGNWIHDYRGGGLPLNDLRARDNGTARYAWAIPDEKALTLLLALGPLIELGAGCGYWASLLKARGGDIVAYDRIPPTDKSHSNGYCKRTEDKDNPVIGTTFMLVKKGQVKPLREHPHRTLFLCWPPYGDRFAATALRVYKGRRFAFVGEGDGGCTADENFFKQLENEWQEETTHNIPQWWAIHDCLTIYRRKEGGAS
jgi:hypothetical protein